MSNNYQIIESYIKKHVEESSKIRKLPTKDVSMIVVIPSHNEADLLDSLKSLAECNKPEGSVEVIVVINAAENAASETLKLHEETYRKCKSWTEKHSPNWLRFHYLMENNLPIKHAGVGLARKIGMDEAVQRLLYIEKAEAPIVCFDADSKCLRNYFIEIELHFRKNRASPACSIHFEHPISGKDFPQEVYKAIQHYELHLRYYKQALEYAGAAFAFHSVGSSMAVRMEDYCKQGGMNKRKAGEDFYFLQKFIELGSFSELKSTMVIPSPRSSDRVPFGTGRAVLQHLDEAKSIANTYHISSFLIVKKFFQMLPEFYRNVNALPSVEVLGFLGGKKMFQDKILEIRAQSTSQNAFEKRFFRWFNAFKTLKYMHYLRDEYFGEMNVVEAALELEKLNGEKENPKDLKDVLNRYRSRDRN